MTTRWAIIITEDHLNGPKADAERNGFPPDPADDDTGSVWRNDPEMGRTLKASGKLAVVGKMRRNHFRAYDDDGILYYDGYLYWTDEDGDNEPDDDALYGVHRSLMVHAGVTHVKYTNHPEWEIG